MILPNVSDLNDRQTQIFDAEIFEKHNNKGNKQRDIQEISHNDKIMYSLKDFFSMDKTELQNNVFLVKIDNTDDEKDLSSH